MYTLTTLNYIIYSKRTYPDGRSRRTGTLLALQSGVIIVVIVVAVTRARLTASRRMTRDLMAHALGGRNFSAVRVQQQRFRVIAAIPFLCVHHDIRGWFVIRSSDVRRPHRNRCTTLQFHRSMELEGRLDAAGSCALQLPATDVHFLCSKVEMTHIYFQT